MRTRDLVKLIAAEAHRQGVVWELKRHGSRHEVYQLGSEIIPIPRHREIKERPGGRFLLNVIWF